LPGIFPFFFVHVVFCYLEFLLSLLWRFCGGFWCLWFGCFWRVTWWWLV
jgi:hypothetical protein